MARVKIGWLSRHEMTKEQYEDLCGIYLHIVDEDERNIEVVTENITWQATNNSEDDHSANYETWLRLMKNYDAVAGVFPPVAIFPYMYDFDDIFDELAVYSPVSEQSIELRADGKKEITFKHVRFVELGGI